MTDLTDEEKSKAAAQVEYFLELISRRYDVRPDEVLEAVRWVREKKAFSEKMRATGLVSTVGLLVSAIALVIWEGVKAMVQRSN